MSICVIPARGGSRRIPRKNLKVFCGAPIILYSIKTAQDCGLFDRVIVSTDDLDIGEVASSHGAEVLIRSPELCRDEVGTQEVMSFVLTKISAVRDHIACCLYPCAPLVAPMDLRIANQICFLRPSRYVISVAGNPLRDIGNFYIGAAGDFMDLSALYATWTGIYVMPPERAIDINTPEDWTRAEQMYKALHEQAS